MDAERLQQLSERWQHLWLGLGTTRARVPSLDALLAAYAVPARAYHNLRHIEECLRELDQARSWAERPDEVELAIWFHDAVYDPRRGDNEERSAEMAVDWIEAAGLSGLLGERVRQLVLATRHKDLPEGADARLLMDVDLSILGQPPAVFDEYERGIRLEYAHVDEKTFRHGRAKILRRFLAGPIYQTDFLRTRYQTQARENLARSVAALETGLI